VFWVPVAAWGVAALLCVVVLGFGAYELAWKTRRLQRDLQQLRGLADQLTTLRGQVLAAQERVAATRPG
jgi:hypothetical protein